MSYSAVRKGFRSSALEREILYFLARKGSARKTFNLGIQLTLEAENVIACLAAKKISWERKRHE